MAHRDSKKITLPPRPRTRITRRGMPILNDRSAAFTPLVDVEDLEPVINTHPTLREIELPHSAGPIDNMARKQRRSTGSLPVVHVHLATVTNREITVLIRDQPLTLSREDALALASIIQTALT